VSPLRQAAVLAVRNERICLVMSSSGRRWVIPKGHIDPGCTAAEAALQEAWEEAGLVGVLQARPLGSYRYHKAGLERHVTVFLMDVTEQARVWPEAGHRKRCWASLRSALARLEDPGLRRLVTRAFASAVEHV
jgi:8-oxo-dGTP pyrophosphatase MutT (NUDIX family)